jgi:hypothetical protein
MAQRFIVALACICLTGAALWGGSRIELNGH